MAVDEKLLQEILEDFSRSFPTSIEVVPFISGEVKLYMREGRLYAEALVREDGTIKYQTRDTLDLPDPLVRATCCPYHAACFLVDREDPSTGVCVYCAPRKSIFRTRPTMKDKAIQAAADEALQETGVRLDGVEAPQTWEGD